LTQQLECTLKVQTEAYWSLKLPVYRVEALGTAHRGILGQLSEVDHANASRLKWQCPLTTKYCYLQLSKVGADFVTDGFQTPASSRRFLPLSSSSAQPQTNIQTPAPVKQPLGSTHYSLPSSSSKFPQTPRFKIISGKPKDDIEASFENESSSPLLPSRSKFTPSTWGGHDDIDDLDEDTATRGHESYTKSRKEEEYILVEPSLQENLKGHSRAKSKIADPVQDSVEDVFMSTSRKRQRVSGSNEEFIDEVRNSPSPNPLKGRDVVDDEDKYEHLNIQRDTQAEVDDTPNEASSPSISPVIGPSLVPSRFRLPNTRATDVKRQSRAPAFAKPSFKAPPVYLQTSTFPSSGPAFPDAFSPSRRRRKRDYIANGAAETVRNWVLGLAAEESQSGRLPRQAQPEAEHICVAEVTQDRSGRCVVVQSEDGKTWLLVGPQGMQASRDRMSGALTSISAGSTIDLKGAGTQWQLNVHDRSSTGEPRIPYSVSVFWDLGTSNTNTNQT
jgi:hypothetical protein